VIRYHYIKAFMKQVQKNVRKRALAARRFIRGLIQKYVDSGYNFRYTLAIAVKLGTRAFQYFMVHYGKIKANILIS